MSVQDFQIIAKLGQGAYSSVYKVRRLSDNIEYALKKVKLGNLSDQEQQNALNEVRILASIRHQNIVGYKQAFLDEPSNSLCIVMEYANNGDLFQRIVELQKQNTLMVENEIWNIFIQVVKGLKALHDLQIFHRDLKSANVFLTKEGIVKFGDMNVSKVAQKGLLYTQTGTPYYASPEVWKDQPYDSKSDIWSLGCVLYEMTTLKPPFRAEDMEGLYQKVIRGYYPRIPQALLQVAPHLRPSCDKILQLPSVVKRLSETILNEPDEGIPFLLNTIKIPKNMHYLTDRLPKPNYSELKMRKIDKNKFLQTLAGYKDNGSNINGIEDDQSYHDNGSRHSMLPKINQKGPSSIRETEAGDYENDRFEKDSNNQSIIHQSSHHHGGARSHSRKNKNKVPAVNNRNQSQVASIRGSEAGNSHRNADIKQLELVAQIKRREVPPEISPPQSLPQYEEQDKYRDLQKVYEVKVHKKQIQDLSPARQPPHHINSQQEQLNINILDIQGQSKPLIIKGNGQKALNSSLVDDYDRKNQDDNSKLPSLGAQHHQMQSNNDISKLPPIQGSNILAAPKMSVKDLSQIQEISKAYKVGISVQESKQRLPQKKPLPIEKRKEESTDFQDNQIVVIPKLKDKRSQKESQKLDNIQESRDPDVI